MFPHTRFVHEISTGERKSLHFYHSRLRGRQHVVPAMIQASSRPRAQPEHILSSPPVQIQPILHALWSPPAPSRELENGRFWRPRLSNHNKTTAIEFQFLHLNTMAWQSLYVSSDVWNFIKLSVSSQVVRSPLSVSTVTSFIELDDAISWSRL